MCWHGEKWCLVRGCFVLAADVLSYAPAPLHAILQVRGIPALLIIDGETGELINQQGREALGEDPQCENFPWRPKTFQQARKSRYHVVKGGAECRMRDLYRYEA